MKFKLFFLSFFCVIMCGVFFYAAYFVYQNSQSVFSEKEQLSVSLTQNGEFYVRAEGKTQLLTLLPDLEAVSKNSFVSPTLRSVSAVYEFLFSISDDFFKKIAQIT